MDIGFALITGNPFFSEIVKVENELHDKCGFHNYLGCQSNIPHTTLFQGTFKDGFDYKEALKQIREYFLSNCRELTLSFDEVVYMPYGWYFYKCKNTEELKRLHYKTLDLCKNDIVLKSNRFVSGESYLTKDQKEGIETYGYRYSGKAYYPHITLGRNDGELNEDIIELLNKRTSKIDSIAPVERITAYRMGKDGMHTETLEEVRV